MGVLPGLKATGRGVNVNLRELDGRTGTPLGSLWTTLVVAQVAVAVAVLPLAVYMTWQVVEMGIAGPEVAATEFVVGEVAMGDEASTRDASRIRGQQLALTARLEREPGVSAVTFASGVPGFAPGRLLRFTGAEGVRYVGADLGVGSLDVSLDLFAAYDAEMIAGRFFTTADLGAANAVIVNRAFVHEFLQPGHALGIRFRYVAPYERPGTAPEATYEIIGVVRDFPRFPPEPGSEGDPTIYHPAAAGEVHPLTLSVRFAGPVPSDFHDRFRTIGAEVDPTLQLRRVVPLADFYDQRRSVWRYLAWGVGSVTTSVLLLSAAGIYALTSFTVAQRTREIAIRAALGAAPQQLVFNMFGRVTAQLMIGLLIGSLLSAAVFQNTDFTLGRAATLTLVVAVVMSVVGLLAALGPARRGLRIQASEALRADT
jgi:putative ABC transport system permease protein